MTRISMASHSENVQGRPPHAGASGLRSGARAEAIWITESGRMIAVERLDMKTFSLSDNDLCILASGGRALWVGSSLDLIADQNARVGFRQALKTADDVLQLASPDDETDRLCLIHDIIGGRLEADRHAA